MAKRRAMFRRWLFGCGVLVTIVAGGIAVPNLVVTYAARGYEYEMASTVPARRVAIVPGARVLNRKPFVHLTARLEGALALYRLGRVKAILVSGNNSPASPEIDAMRAWLLERGVPESDVWVDEAGTRTRETMKGAAVRFGVTSAVICTQAPNMARSIFLAQQAGIDAVGISLPTDLSRSFRYVSTEALKTALAFFESSIGQPPVGPPVVAAVTD